ncbi:MAG: hypothetical protein RIQ93_3120 [Verrucomicrobiota bacterium]|jgi:hypothetical protein
MTGTDLPRMNSKPEITAGLGYIRNARMNLYASSFLCSRCRA